MPPQLGNDEAIDEFIDMVAQAADMAVLGEMCTSNEIALGRTKKARVKKLLMHKVDANDGD